MSCYATGRAAILLTASRRCRRWRRRSSRRRGGRLACGVAAIIAGTRTATSRRGGGRMWDGARRWRGAPGVVPFSSVVGFFVVQFVAIDVDGRTVIMASILATSIAAKHIVDILACWRRGGSIRVPPSFESTGIVGGHVHVPLARGLSIFSGCQTQSRHLLLR